MDIILSVDEGVARRARDAAHKMGKSLNQVVSDYVEQLAGEARKSQQWTNFDDRCHYSQARLGSWHFHRDDAAER